MKLQFSIIIPVYNRPQEIEELLESLTNQTYKEGFEILIVEDGSDNTCEAIVSKYNSLNIKYFLKKNTGAGASRNYGMQQATGNYFIIFDSDCLIPSHYLEEVDKVLAINFTDAYGGADAAHESFTTIQKAINYSMTSFFTTGGIRGSKKAVDKFQPRSFNMGLSKKAFEVTEGFSKMKVGEDIDLTFRLWKHQFKTQLIPNAFVYHKRRTTLKQFFKQTFAFGKTRPLLNKKYPNSAKITYWFPTLFVLFMFFSILGFLAGYQLWITLLVFYLTLIFIDSLLKNKSIAVAFYSILTTIVQFLGYGLGFLKGLIAK